MVDKSPNDAELYESYAHALRISAKLMAFYALKRADITHSEGEGWLRHAVACDRLAAMYERKVEKS